MIQACKLCTKQFDVTKQSTLCPHKPHPKLCTEHDRMNCGNPQCEKEALKANTSFILLRQEVA